MKVGSLVRISGKDLLNESVLAFTKPEKGNSIPVPDKIVGELIEIADNSKTPYKCCVMLDLGNGKTNLWFKPESLKNLTQ